MRAISIDLEAFTVRSVQPFTGKPARVIDTIEVGAASIERGLEPGTA